MRKKIIFALIVGALLGFLVNLPAADEQRKKKDGLFRQVELFSDGLAIIQADYVQEVNFRDLIYGALKGMLASLDPHSQFMDPETYNELKVDTTGKFGGLGIEITIKDGLLTIITPLEDGPAWKAGLKSGDRIVKINGEVTRDITIIDAVKKLRGNPGEAVEITILRESEKKILDLKIVREIIKIKDVKETKMLEENIGYIRLAEFSENTHKEFDTAVDKLTKEGMNAFILDLRNNPGGLLDMAISVTEKFIDKDKLIVSTKGRKSSQSMEFKARENAPILDMPMAVLINEGSASGSEIVAGALQDYKRAIIIGTKSFGKGSVQSVIPLSDGSALRLTTSKYFTPSGKVIHEKGVMPDIVVEDGRIMLSASDQKTPDKPTDVFDDLQKKEGEKKDDAEKYKSDNQLMRAVDILKAVRIYKK